ncbi:hypothetical protein EV715DRAFT_288875 [Schizophyllum commune]
MGYRLEGIYDRRLSLLLLRAMPAPTSLPAFTAARHREVEYLPEATDRRPPSGVMRPY